MNPSPNTDLRRLPSRPMPAVADQNSALEIADLTSWPRMGLRGSGTPDWCTAHGLPFPEEVNEVSATEALRIARLGTFELLVLPIKNVAFAQELHDLSSGTFDAYREESWAWLRLAGRMILDALATCTSADLTPDQGGAEKIVQTRFAGLDAVLIVKGDAERYEVDVFFDIASYNYVVDVLADRCPDFGLISSDCYDDE